MSKRGADVMTTALDGLPAEVAAGVIAQLPHGHAIGFLAGRDDQRIAALIDAADLDHALAILLFIASDRRKRVLECLANRRKRRTLRQLVVYPPGSIGTMLNPVAARLQASMSLADAVELLRGDELESDQEIWLVDDNGNYRGLLDSGRALTARNDQVGLDEFLLRIRPLRAETTVNNAFDSEQWLQHAELPVIDEHGHLLGTITRSRLLAEAGGADSGASGLIDGFSELAQQYFRVLGICLGDLFDTRRPRK